MAIYLVHHLKRKQKNFAPHRDLNPDLPDHNLNLTTQTARLLDPTYYFVLIRIGYIKSFKFSAFRLFGQRASKAQYQFRLSDVQKNFFGFGARTCCFYDILAAPLNSACLKKNSETVKIQKTVFRKGWMDLKAKRLLRVMYLAAKIQCLFSITQPNVVYFDQRTGAPPGVCWLKYTF